MGRLPLIQDDARSSVLALIESIAASRRGRVNNLYRTLLNSPAITRAWLAFITDIRAFGVLDEMSRELVTLRIAHLTGAQYIRDSHQRMGRLSGLTREQMDEISDWQSSQLFDPKARAVLAYCDVLTTTSTAPDTVFDALREWFDDRELLELTVTTGVFNMVARCLVPLQVDMEPWDE